MTAALASSGGRLTVSHAAVITGKDYSDQLLTNAVGGGRYSLYFSYTYVPAEYPFFDNLFLADHLTNGNLLSICPINSLASQIIID